MRIALLGYGKMGRLVETLAVREGWEVSPKLDIDDNAAGSGITRDSMAGVDVALDLRLPVPRPPDFVLEAQPRINTRRAADGPGAVGRDQEEAHRSQHRPCPRHGHLPQVGSPRSGAAGTPTDSEGAHHQSGRRPGPAS